MRSCALCITTIFLLSKNNATSSHALQSTLLKPNTAFVIRSVQFFFLQGYKNIRQTTEPTTMIPKYIEQM